MPTIKKLPRKKKEYSNTGKRKERQRLYQMKGYREMRNEYLREHLWCEECLKDGIYTCSNLQVHHKKSIVEDGISEAEQLDRLYDTDNWVLLCDYHHRKEHHKNSPIEDYDYEEKKRITNGRPWSDDMHHSMFGRFGETKDL